MLWELCRKYTGDQESALLQYNMNRNSFQAPVTAVVYKSTLMDYIFDGKINIFGKEAEVEREWRVRHITHLIEELEKNSSIRIFLLENNNPYIGYDDLQSTILLLPGHRICHGCPEWNIRLLPFFSQRNS